MSRARLRRLERAITVSAASHVITGFGHLPDLPLPDADSANPTYQPGPAQGPTYSIKPVAQAIAEEFGAPYNAARMQHDPVFSGRRMAEVKVDQLHCVLPV
jgi:hypothetical protein